MSEIRVGFACSLWCTMTGFITDKGGSGFYLPVVTINNEMRGLHGVVGFCFSLLG